MEALSIPEIIVLCVLALFFTFLLWRDKIGDWPFAALIGLMVVTGFGIALYPRLQEIRAGKDGITVALNKAKELGMRRRRRGTKSTLNKKRCETP